MIQAADRPSPREAGPELLVLAHWEAFIPWLLACCGRWPRSARFSLTQRIENHALDVLELLVVARYQPRQRARSLQDVNLVLERMRFLSRIARTQGFMSMRAFDKAMRDIDEAGRMVWGWRQHLRSRGTGSTTSKQPPTHARPETST